MYLITIVESIHVFVITMGASQFKNENIICGDRFKYKNRCIASEYHC